jgi:Cysteine-rich CPCC
MGPCVRLCHNRYYQSSLPGNGRATVRASKSGCRPSRSERILQTCPGDCRWCGSDSRVFIETSHSVRSRCLQGDDEKTLAHRPSRCGTTRREVMRAMTPSHIKYQCLCCDHFTLDEEPAYYRSAPPRCPLCASTRSVCSAPVHAQRRPVQRCPMCGWISDFYQEHDVQLRGRPNGVSLREAQDNYRGRGATPRAALATVRPTNTDEDASLWRHPHLQHITPLQSERTAPAGASYS